MQLLPISALAANAGCGAFDQMLQYIGIAAIVWAFFKGIKSLMPQPGTPPSPVAAPLAAKAPAPPVLSDDISPATVAVIAAAVAYATGSSRRIVSIMSRSSHWEKAGRQSVLTSHRIR